MSNDNFGQGGTEQEVSIQKVETQSEHVVEDSGLLSSEDFSTATRRFEDVGMLFNALADNLSKVTIKYANRAKMFDKHFPDIANLDEEFVKEYYIRLIAARLKNVYEPYGSLYTWPGHFFPKGFSLKHAPMIDMLQKVLANIEVTIVEEPAVRITPEVDLSKFIDETTKQLRTCNADKLENLLEWFDLMEQKYNIPIMRGVPKEPEGDSSFMKFCMINDVLRSMQPSVNPGILALVSLSGHKLEDDKYSNMFNYYHDDVTDLVINKIISRG